MYNYEDDKLHGPYRLWSADPYARFSPGTVPKKRVDEIGNYKYSVLDGPFKTGLVNRERHAEGQFTDGKQTGVWRYYNHEDKLVLEETYDEVGELIKVKMRRKFLFFHYYQSEDEFNDAED